MKKKGNHHRIHIQFFYLNFCFQFIQVSSRGGFCSKSVRARLWCRVSDIYHAIYENVQFCQIHLFTLVLPILRIFSKLLFFFAILKIVVCISVEITPSSRWCFACEVVSTFWKIDTLSVFFLLYFVWNQKSYLEMIDR